MRKKNVTGFQVFAYCIAWLFIAALLMAYWYIAVVVIALVAIVVGSLLLYGHFYFRGYVFDFMKSKISGYVNDCNDLNNHIIELRNSSGVFRQTDYGDAKSDSFRYSKKAHRDLRYAPNIYRCSQAVCDSAKNQPFKYLCKYFNIPENESSLVLFESMLNNFLSVEDGKILSQRKRDAIMATIDNAVPWLIKKLFPSRLSRELGFEEFQFDELNYPVYSFVYTSAGGRTGSHCDIELNINNLERFIAYLSERVKFKKSVIGQRRLMTPKLRQSIIQRDNFTCKICGNSSYIEPNLLLEVDHIIPVSKGGMTTEENLQTLCWKCNRHKGNKM